MSKGLSDKRNKDNPNIKREWRTVTENVNLCQTFEKKIREALKIGSYYAKADARISKLN